MMVVLFIVLLILLYVTLVNNYSEKSIFYPPFLFSAIWFIVLLVYFLVKIIYPAELFEIHTKTVLFICMGSIAFTAGGYYLKSFKKGTSEDPMLFRPTKVPRLLDEIVLIISVIGAIIIFYRARDIVKGIEAENFFIALRYQLTVKRVDYGIAAYFVVFGLFASLFRLFTFRNLSELTPGGRFKLAISILISLFCLVFSTGRTYVFFYLISVLVIIYLKNQLKTRQIKILVTIIILSFVLIGLYLNKGGSFSDSLSDNITAMSKHLLAYLDGPLVAFDKFFTSDFENTYGLNTFRFFHAVFHELNLINAPPVDIVKEYVFIPYPTNVYTVYYQYILDFGIAGCLILFFLFGIVQSWFFFRARRSGNHFKLLAAYLYFPLVMVFFQDQYFSLFSFWLQLWFYSFIVLYLSEKYGEQPDQ